MVCLHTVLVLQVLYVFTTVIENQNLTLNTIKCFQSTLYILCFIKQLKSIHLNVLFNLALKAVMGGAVSSLTRPAVTASITHAFGSLMLVRVRLCLSIFAKKRVGQSQRIHHM